MGQIIIAIGMLTYIIGMFLINRTKKNFSNEAILEYEKSIRPKFYKFFMLAMTPMLLILFSLLSNNLEILNYFLVLIIITLSLNLLTFYKLSNAIKISNYSLELSQFPIYFGIVMFGKLVTLIGLKFYIEQLLLLGS